MMLSTSMIMKSITVYRIDDYDMPLRFYWVKILTLAISVCLWYYICFIATVSNVQIARENNVYKTWLLVMDRDYIVLTIAMY